MGKGFIEKMFLIFRDGDNHAATIFIGANLHICQCALFEGMGSEIPIKIAG